MTTLVGDGQFRADGPLTLWTPSGSRTYRGALRAASPSPGSSDRDTVNVVSLDHYVQGVIAAEMPTSWAPGGAEGAGRRGPDLRHLVARREPRPLLPDLRHLLLPGLPRRRRRGRARRRGRHGDVPADLAADGGAAFTQFASSSGGWLSAGSRPYLVAKADPYDDFAGNPVHDWTVSLRASRIQDAYPGIGRLSRLHVTRREGGGQWGGRVVTVVLDGSKKNLTISGDTFRPGSGCAPAGSPADPPAEARGSTPRPRRGAWF